MRLVVADSLIFNGLGTTALYCKNENIEYLGIDINKKYIDETKKRLNIKE